MFSREREGSELGKRKSIGREKNIEEREKEKERGRERVGWKKDDGNGDGPRVCKKLRRIQDLITRERERQEIEKSFPPLTQNSRPFHHFNQTHIFALSNILLSLSF